MVASRSSTRGHKQPSTMRPRAEAIPLRRVPRLAPSAPAGKCSPRCRQTERQPQERPRSRAASGARSGTHCHDKVGRGSRADIFDPVLLIRADKSKRARPQNVACAVDGELHGAFANEPHFRVHMMVRGMRRGAGREGGFVRDRKSTRLNSSHLVISYAVFCLKKKKNSK